MGKPNKKAPQITSIHEAPTTNLFGVDFTVLLPREQGEAMEVLLERYPKGVSFPVHQHTECEQFYFILDGEAEVSVGEKRQRVKNGSVVYIPRNTDHSVSNIGSGELVYVVCCSYPDGYLHGELTWEDHINSPRLRGS